MKSLHWSNPLETYCTIHRHILQMFAYHAEINYDDTGGRVLWKQDYIQIDAKWRPIHLVSSWLCLDLCNQQLLVLTSELRIYMSMHNLRPVSMNF